VKLVELNKFWISNARDAFHATERCLHGVDVPAVDSRVDSTQLLRLHGQTQLEASKRSCEIRIVLGKGPVSNQLFGGGFVDDNVSSRFFVLH
jgi:hypothetical protein